MIDKGTGRVVIISSIGAISPMPKSSIYSSIKSGIYAYGKSIAAELSDKEITGFKIMYILSLSQKFEGRKIILELIEQNLMKFYQGVVQHLKKWEKPAPKILKKNNLNNLDEFQSNNDNSVAFDDRVGNVLTNWKKRDN